MPAKAGDEFESIVKAINALEPLFEYERHDALNFHDDAEKLRYLYPLIAGWADVSIQNAWDRYAVAVAGATSLDVDLHAEFLGYLVYLTNQPDPEVLHPEVMICSEEIHKSINALRLLQVGDDRLSEEA